MKKHLQTFSEFILILSKELYNHILSLLALVILYLLLWHFDQAQDLLLTLNQKDSYQGFVQVPLYFFSLFILACLIWNIPKYLHYWNIKEMNGMNFLKFSPDYHYEFYRREFEREDLTQKRQTHLHIKYIIPRILGCYVFIISALAVIKAFDDFGYVEAIILKYHCKWIAYLFMPHLYLFFTFIITGLLLNFKQYNRYKKHIKNLKNRRTLLGVILFFIVSVLVVLGFINQEISTHLGYLFIAKIFLLVLFFTFSFTRKDILKTKSQRQNFYNFLLISIFAYLLAFIIFNFSIHTSQTVNPLSVFIIALLCYLSLTHFLMLIGRKHKFALLTFSTLFFVGISVWANSKIQYSFYLVEPTSLQEKVKRTSLEEYTDEWIKEKMPLIMEKATAEHPYPIFFVASQGGGSKGGLWSSVVHSYLHENTKGNYFNNHLFLLTGASGGSVGNSLYFNTVAENRSIPLYQNQVDSTQKQTLFGAFYQHNFLSSSIVGLLGRDALQSTFFLPLTQNRAEVLETEWQKAYHNHVDNTHSLQIDFLHYYLHQKNKIPLLVLNTTHVQTGQYTLISPVEFPFLKNGKTAFRDFYTDLHESENLKTDSLSLSIPLSTAMSMNAAFPYITSAGELKNKGQYVDAGYYDNIGGTVTQKVYEVFKERLYLYILQLYKTKNSIQRLKSNQIEEFISFRQQILDKVNLQTLLLINDKREFHKNYQSASQYFVPINALVNVRSGHTSEQIGSLPNATSIILEENGITKNQKGTTILPLGRYLSNRAVQSIEEHIYSPKVQPVLDSLVQQINYFNKP